jgi:hypothetical protein
MQRTISLNLPVGCVVAHGSSDGSALPPDRLDFAVRCSVQSNSDQCIVPTKRIALIPSVCMTAINAKSYALLRRIDLTDVPRYR